MRWTGSGRLAAALLVAVSAQGTQAQEAAPDEGAIRLRPRVVQPRVAPEIRRRRLAETDPRADRVARELVTRARRARESRELLRGKQGAVLRELSGTVAGDVVVHMRGDTRTPRQIKARKLLRGHGFLATAGVDRDVALAMAFLERNRELIGLDEPSEELRLLRKEVDDLGRTQVRFTQIYKNIPVVPGELIVHIDREGDIVLMDGGYHPTPRNAVIEPALDRDAALAAAQESVGPGQAIHDPELVLFARNLGGPRLAWDMTIRQSLIHSIRVVVDAASGGILERRNLVMSDNVPGSGVDLLGQSRSLNVWRDGVTHYLVDTSKPMFDASSDPLGDVRGGILVLDAQNGPGNALFYVTSPSANSWSLPASVSMAWGLSQTYDYYDQVFGRNSFDGGGASMIGIVRYETDYFNAFWNGQVMVFGDADRLATIDVIAHEMTHAVVQHSANLEYISQSGALNESFADIFAEMVENRAKGTNDWLIGTDLVSGPFRSMTNPNAFNQPSRMSEYRNLPETDAGDNGGVHSNSGIPNHCFYLLAAGMNGAIGRDKAAAIFYRALTTHLTKSSQFKDARLACIASAEEIHGIGSAEADAVAQAFALVEIGSAPASDTSRDVPEVGAPDSLLFVFDDGSGIQLGRRDLDAGDDDLGSYVDPDVPVTLQRLAVSGDGTFGVCVTEDNDVGFIDLYGAASATGDPEITPLGVPNFVHSIAMDPSGDRFAFVTLDASGFPTNEVTIIDIAADTTETFTLEAALVDGGTTSIEVLYADAMDFTSDGRFLVYDALNVVTIGTRDVELWSIYGLDIGNATTVAIVAPIEGLAIGYPSFAQTSDNTLVFEAFDEVTEESTVYAGNLETGELGAPIAVVPGDFAVPSFNGDDSAVVYQVPDGTSTGSSIHRRPVSDRIHPTGGAAVELSDAAFAAVYRHGDFTVPNAEPDATIDTPFGNVTIDAGGFMTFTSTGWDLNGHVPLAYSWDFDGGAPNSGAEDPGAIQFATPGIYVITLTVTDSQGLADSTPHQRTVIVQAPSSGGGGGCVMSPDSDFDPTLLLLIAGVYLYGRRRWRAG